MSQILITQDLFNNLDYDMDNLKVASNPAAVDGSKNPTLLVVFAKSDINAALYHLNKSLQSPWDNNAIATVLVQEAIKEDFVQKLQLQLKPYDKEIIAKQQHFLDALQTCKKLNARLITAVGEEVAPTLVCDFTHEHLGSGHLSGVVTLHTFRTAKEAIALAGKETVKFDSVSIWHENHAYAYELVAALKSSNFFINCHQVPLTTLQAAIKEGKPYVCMDKSYHYETLPSDGLMKSVVFPVGSIFAN